MIISMELETVVLSYLKNIYTIYQNINQIIKCHLSKTKENGRDITCGVSGVMSIHSWHPSRISLELRGRTRTTTLTGITLPLLPSSLAILYFWKENYINRCFMFPCIVNPLFNNLRDTKFSYREEWLSKNGKEQDKDTRWYKGNEAKRQIAVIIVE